MTRVQADDSTFIWKTHNSFNAGNEKVYNRHTKNSKDVSVIKKNSKDVTATKLLYNTCLCADAHEHVVKCLQGKFMRLRYSLKMSLYFYSKASNFFYH